MSLRERPVLRPHSISKKDHRAQYRPSRVPRHLASEGYLRPDQVAKAVFFEFIDDFKKPTIRSVVHRRLLHEDKRASRSSLESLPPAAQKEQRNKTKTEMRDPRPGPNAKHTAHAIMWEINAIGSQLSVKHPLSPEADSRPQSSASSRKPSRKPKRRSPPAHVATATRITENANHELDTRILRCTRKMHNLESQLKGVGVEDLISEEEHMLAAHLPGSPRKYRGPRRMTAIEIIDRRKNKNKRIKDAMKDDSTDKAWEHEMAEKAEKRKLGLERRERCYMCQRAYPKGTCTNLVIEKCIHEWRMLQKAVRRAKKQIRRRIHDLGDGGAAQVFRIAVKTSIDKEGGTQKMVRKAKSKFMAPLRGGHRTSSYSTVTTSAGTPRRPASAAATAASIGKSPRTRVIRANSSLACMGSVRKLRPESSEGSRANHRRRSTSNLRSAEPLLATATPGAITYDQFFMAMYKMFGLEVQSDAVRRELLAWLDRDRGGDISFSEFCNLTDSLENAGKKRRGLYYAAVPGSDRQPELTLEAMDDTQQVMQPIPMRLVHTLYEKKRVCSFCMQILFSQTFGLDGKGGVKGFGNTEPLKWGDGTTFHALMPQAVDPGIHQNVTLLAEKGKIGVIASENSETAAEEAEEAEDVGWSPRIMPVTMTTKHVPHDWKTVSDDICESMRVRRATTPFETWDEHHIYGPHVKHYMNFNQVPTPKHHHGRSKAPVKQVCVCSNRDPAGDTQTRASNEADDGPRFKSQIDLELAALYAQYRNSGAKTLESFELSHEFRKAEKGFYALHKQEFAVATKKRRKAMMATAKDQDLAAAKLQAILRGRKTRKEEMERAREIRRKEIEKREAARAEAKETHDSELRRMEERMARFNNTRGLKKLQAMQRGRSIRRRSAVAERKMLLSKQEGGEEPPSRPRQKGQEE
jgi:hypothetical protein